MIGVYLLFASTNPSIFGYTSIIAPIQSWQATAANGVDPSVKFLEVGAESSHAPHWAIFLAFGLIGLGSI
jgi:hypothetical protein